MKKICWFIFIVIVCFLSVLVILAIYFFAYIFQSNTDIDKLHSSLKNFWSKDKKYDLRHFTPRDVVSCFDEFHLKSCKKWLHFAFIGDSRVRQQFFNLLKLIPNGDRRQAYLDENQIILTISPSLQVIVSFLQSYLIDDANKLIDHISQWLQEPPVLLKPGANYPPNFILIGISAHHMLTYNGADYKKYERKLQEIKQVLDELVHVNNRPKIFWLNQFPTIDFWAKNGESEVDVYSEKIHQYNLILRRVFQNSPVLIWDSGNPIAEEYVRSCLIFKRCEFHLKKEKLEAYFNCFDYIHTGYAALSQVTQILLNGLCNKS